MNTTFQYHGTTWFVNNYLIQTACLYFVTKFRIRRGAQVSRPLRPNPLNREENEARERERKPLLTPAKKDAWSLVGQTSRSLTLEVRLRLFRMEVPLLKADSILGNGLGGRCAAQSIGNNEETEFTRNCGFGIGSRFNLLCWVFCLQGGIYWTRHSNSS